VIAPFCYVLDHEHGFSKQELILNQRSVLKETTIGRDCYLGTGCVILGGVHLGDGAIIGAGSIVTRDVPAYEMWAGNPAKFVKVRD
jgi:acetyltransferase-like isoleucine patch superfamily enzyme